MKTLMLDDLKSLPKDPEELRAISELLMAEVKSQAYQIEKLKSELAGHRKARFGSKSESMDHLALDLVDDAEIVAAAEDQKFELPSDLETEPERQHSRKSLPDHLERREEVLSPDKTCTCGGVLRQIGEDVTDELEYIPGRFVVAGSFKVNQRVRPGSAGAPGSIAINSKKLSFPDCITQLCVLIASCLPPRGTVTPSLSSISATPCSNVSAPMAK